MGFFKKVFKGVGKVFKKIGRGIKKVASKVGKFMNKIGIVGQIAMAFILPGVGNMLMQGAGGLASSMVANSLGGITGAIVKGAGHVVRAAHKFVTVGKNAFNTVSQGVTKFIGEFSKTALNKIPGVNIKGASKNFFGKGGAWETVQNDIVKNASRITDPFKRSITVEQGMTIDDIANSTGLPKDVIKKTNVGLDVDRLSPGDVVNFDPDVDTYTLNIESGKFRPSPMSATEKAKYLGTSESLLDNPQGFRPPQMSPEELQEYLGTTSSATNVGKVTTDTSDFISNVVDEAREFTAGRYNFESRPIASSIQAVKDVATVQEAIDPEPIELGGYGGLPAYVGVGAQDLDVTVQSAPRNFAAYSGAGQFGSTARLYDSILMQPVSSWSRDLASRTA